jgi:DNA-binding IclR family transcriptional regulator
MTSDRYPGPMAPEDAPRLDSTIVKAFGLIEYLAASEQPVGVSAVAQQFGWQKSNAHRLLTTLKALGYVRQEATTSRYELSLKTWELGMKVVGRSLIKRCAQPFMRNLNQQFHEGVNLSILVGDDILYLDNLPSAYPLRPTASPGARVPAVFTASGKCLMAHRADAPEIARRIIGSHPQAAKMSWLKLKQELETIRNAGYAISLSGWRASINSIAAPILNRQGMSIAAISINGPAERLSPEVLAKMSPALMNAAAQITDTIGGDVP